jgi:hypothetical protein
MAALARKASLSDRSVQKTRNDVRGDWLSRGTAGPPFEYSSVVDDAPLTVRLIVYRYVADVHVQAA